MNVLLNLHVFFQINSPFQIILIFLTNFMLLGC